MKHLLSFIAVAAITTHVFAQVPVTTGLRLHLDASAPASYTANSTGMPSTWSDLSGTGNHLTSANGGTAKPTFIATVPNSNGHSGVQFDGAANVMWSTGTTGSFSDTTATMFVVRVADNTAIDSNSLHPVRALLSIAANGTFDQEFGILTDWAIHHASSGSWTRKTHQCYTQLPSNRPAIQSVVFGGAPTSIAYSVNGILSTSGLSYQSSPGTYAAVSRRIYIGARNGGYQEFFNGIVLEVLAYDRMLSAAEVTSVNNYLKCKYQINYTTCNNPIACGGDGGTGGGGTGGTDTTGHLAVAPRSDAGIALEQNVPNPVNGEAYIAYNVPTLKQSAFVALYDLNGRQIARYPVAQAGDGRVTVSTNGLRAGLYLYSLTVDGIEMTARKKMVVLE